MFNEVNAIHFETASLMIGLNKQNKINLHFPSKKIKNKINLHFPSNKLTLLRSIAMKG